MINNEFRSSGLIDSNGQLKIYNNAHMNYFAKKYKDHKVLIEVKVIGTKASSAIIGYYRSYILPEFQKAIMEREQDYLTLKGTEDHITNLTPMLNEEIWDENIKQYITSPKKFEDLDNYEAVHCLIHLKQIASLEYGFCIEDEVS